jgi:hypothetical protein
MRGRSQETLRKIQKNDKSLTKLEIGVTTDDRYPPSYAEILGGFYSTAGGDYSRLGTAIATNNHLTELEVNTIHRITSKEFYIGLKQNSSIYELWLHGEYQDLAGGLGHKILQVYQENNHLTTLSISCIGLHNGGDNIIAETLKCCTNIREVSLGHNHMTDEQLIPIIKAIRGQTSLETLDLMHNSIGNVGCEKVATLLEDQSCNLHEIDLSMNQINNIGASILANKLVNNKKLKKLDLGLNPIDGSFGDGGMGGYFFHLLCNTSSIDSICSSNHTLETLNLGRTNALERRIKLLLELNKNTNKSQVVTIKILTYLAIDVTPLFGWGSGEGEWSLKALPYVITWFDRAREVIASDDGFGRARVSEIGVIEVDRRQLSAIYDFAKAMPVLFGGIASEGSAQTTGKKACVHVSEIGVAIANRESVHKCCVIL